ncbi:bombyxin C-1-like [Leguminivora glycinivorella]|uniref:bombyxin C-1-like n=1 Tax=Leguminivora glycinivorella TaxID=1035111 RepID=UPI00200CCC9B|nr:bombyxin C-1-like [Leguminivora glycinivorella]
MKVQISLFFVVVMFFVSVCSQSDDTPQIYCGRRLAQTMAMLCYQKPYKRSDYNSIHLGYEPEFSWPWLSRGLGHMQDRGIAMDMNRGKRGIIEECCQNSCSIQTLMSYC